jgi:hypothetical protein
MGIGADDIFVFVDTWEVVGNEDPALLDDVPARLGRTFSRACSAMLVTSASTAASFFANIVSTLPVIKEFGIFMGLVVTVNFITVLIFFPTLVIFQEKLNCCFGLCGCGKKKKRVGSKARGGTFARAGSGGSPRSFTDDLESDLREVRNAENWREVFPSDCREVFPSD